VIDHDAVSARRGVAQRIFLLRQRNFFLTGSEPLVQRESCVHDAASAPSFGRSFMRPLPPHKTHGVIHTVKVSKEHIEALAKHLIPKDKQKWIKEGDEIHIVREPRKDEEIQTIRGKRPGES
jgi:hypothetical protein